MACFVSCGDIFCKIHAMKELYRRNEKLERRTSKLITESTTYPPQKPDTFSMMMDDDLYSNEREMRICPDCKQKKYLFVDEPHKHRFMDCECLGWNVNQIDFAKQWKKMSNSAMDYQ